MGAGAIPGALNGFWEPLPPGIQKELSLWASLDCLAQLNSERGAFCYHRLIGHALLMQRRGLPLSEQIQRKG